jgi:hypothetical protein
MAGKWFAQELVSAKKLRLVEAQKVVGFRVSGG